MMKEMESRIKKKKKQDEEGKLVEEKTKRDRNVGRTGA